MWDDPEDYYSEADMDEAYERNEEALDRAIEYPEEEAHLPGKYDYDSNGQISEDGGFDKHGYDRDGYDETGYNDYGQHVDD